MFDTRVTHLLNIKYPIVQGGLAYLAYSELAAAVSNAGGLGQITAMSLGSPEELRKEIHKVKQMTDQPFGVNFAIGQHGRPFEHMVNVAIEEEVPVISITGGNPKPVIDMVKPHRIKTLVLVAAKRQAVKAEQLGADAVMVVGQEGGGHLGRGDVGTMVLTPQVVDAVSIPVIASGGIGDGRGLMAALALGAEGIEMGTRFIATEECRHAHPSYKQAILDGDEQATVVIKRSLGTPGRALLNPWTEEILKLEQDDPGISVLKSYIGGEANRRYIYEGHSDKGFGWAGQVVGRIKDIPTVDELIRRIIEEANQIRNDWK
ncbi:MULTISPECIES: NAD(P)H-dependent flavin oxidoreductase [Pontibacillus]|uniref:Probable nitronate monooxygenase n=1 Tax=Pontibacillus chungwhensis TaxID=265426 RepID=A0ABY8V2G6_9BACI|nr:MULTISPECIES: nitronate monooxygenase family protein [Pontibacillus]MCD5322530.1 nitronate monooxygenase family protein [Pontibacillus sp. HN14]WIF99815.1 nitronate monooxygenase family protein [Pontibacillus chungwhensis]